MLARELIGGERSGSTCSVTFVETRRLQGVHEGMERQFALPRKITVVPAPVQEVHVEQRGIGELDQHDPVARNRADRAQVSFADKRVNESRTNPTAG